MQKVMSNPVKLEGNPSVTVSVPTYVMPAMERVGESDWVRLERVSR